MWLPTGMSGCACQWRVWALDTNAAAAHQKPSGRPVASRKCWSVSLHERLLSCMLELLNGVGGQGRNRSAGRAVMEAWDYGLR